MCYEAHSLHSVLISSLSSIPLPQGCEHELSLSQTESSWIAEEVTVRLQSLGDISMLDRVYASSNRLYDLAGSGLERRPSFSTTEKESNFVFSNSQKMVNPSQSIVITETSQEKESVDIRSLHLEDSQAYNSQTSAAPEDVVRSRV